MMTSSDDVILSGQGLNLLVREREAEIRTIRSKGRSTAVEIYYFCGPKHIVFCGK